MDNFASFFKKYGKVFRYQGAGVATAYTKNIGGLQQEGRSLRMEASVVKMLELYPGYCKRNDKKGLPDLALNWRAK